MSSNLSFRLCCFLLLVTLSLGTAGIGAGRPREETIPEYYRDAAVVLLYHHFAPEESGVTITPERLAGHLTMLDEEGFNVVSLDQLAAFLSGSDTLPPNAVAITLDDGYESAYTAVYPLLKERGWPAAVFVHLSDVGRTGAAPQRLKWLTWEQMGEMADYGFIFASHTYRGHHLVYGAGDPLPWLLFRPAGESEAGYLCRVMCDLLLSRHLLEKHLGGKVEHLAFPFGRANHIMLEAAKKCGYRYVWGTSPVAVDAHSNFAELGRINAGLPGLESDALKDAIVACGQTRGTQGAPRQE